MKKALLFFRVWGNDYTLPIYIFKILGGLLTVLYYTATFFNRKKTKEFNRKGNYYIIERKRRIDAWNKPADEAFMKKFLVGDRYNFKGIYFPKIENTTLMRSVYDDSLMVYTEYNDDYSYTVVDELEKKIPEGTYCYIGKHGGDITIKNGYTVIDAGAWIGDFSAYAAKKGAHVYAFEPSPSNITMLEKTISYNKDLPGRITIVPLGLGEKEEDVEFYENDISGNTGGNTFKMEKGHGNTMLHITTLDAWVEKNNIQKIDFIKSDIEGYERHFLRGATKVLQDLHPTLSICTYHLPDDKVVLRDIILKANPHHKIIQRKMKLFAYIDTH